MSVSILSCGDVGVCVCVCVNVDEFVGVSRKESEVLIGDKVVDSELDVSMDLVVGLLDTELLRVEVSIHTSVYTGLYMRFHGYCLNEMF